MERGTGVEWGCKVVAGATEDATEVLKSIS